MAKSLRYDQLLQLAVAEGATTPNPGLTGVVAYSTTLGKPVHWTGSIWTAGSASSPGTLATISGATQGYIWGTDGTNGVVRMSASMGWSKDASNNFVTLAVGDIDCGTF